MERALSHFQGSGTLTHLTESRGPTTVRDMPTTRIPSAAGDPVEPLQGKVVIYRSGPHATVFELEAMPRHRHPGGSGVVGVVQREQFSLAVFRRSPTSVVPDPATGGLLGVGGDLASRWWSCRQGR